MATAATDVIAFGVSAISDVGGLYAQNTHSLVRYREAVTHAGLATERGFACSRDDVRRRGVITQLMCNFHQLMCNFHVDLGAQGEREFAGELARLRQLEREGLVAVRGPEIKITPLGRIFVRNVASVFDAHLTAERPFSRAV
jgi:oxygen-independent coproporphyrinogen-3 oxidase